MIVQKVKVTNLAGLHLEPASRLCETAYLYKCEITFSIRDTVANAKSILSVLAACVKCGDEIELRCNGSDEKEAMEKLLDLFQDNRLD